MKKKVQHTKALSHFVQPYWKSRLGEVGFGCGLLSATPRGVAVFCNPSHEVVHETSLRAARWTDCALLSENSQNGQKSKLICQSVLRFITNLYMSISSGVKILRLQVLLRSESWYKLHGACGLSCWKGARQRALSVYPLFCLTTTAPLNVLYNFAIYRMRIGAKLRKWQARLENSALWPNQPVRKPDDLFGK